MAAALPGVRHHQTRISRALSAPEPLRDQPPEVQPRRTSHDRPLLFRAEPLEPAAVPVAADSALLRSFSFLQGNSGQRGQSFLCRICLANVAAEEGYQVSGCSHTFCRACVSGFASCAIDEGQIHIRCPHWGSSRCSNFLTDDDLVALLDSVVHAKLLRFKALRLDPNARACPKCEATQVGAPEQPAMRCHSCGHCFCFIHDNRHPGQDCDTYDLANSDKLRLEREEERRLLKDCKLCPSAGCRAPTLKADGCNHIICPRCQTHWCWLCGNSFPADGEFPRHFSDPFGCPGGQFLPEGQTLSWWRRGLVLMPWIVTGVPAVALWFAVTLLLLPCLIGIKPFRESWCQFHCLWRIESSLRVLIMGALLLGFVSAFVLLWAALAIVMLLLLLLLMTPLLALYRPSVWNSVVIWQVPLAAMCFPCWILHFRVRQFDRREEDAHLLATADDLSFGEVTAPASPSGARDGLTGLSSPSLADGPVPAGAMAGVLGAPSTLESGGIAALAEPATLASATPGSSGATPHRVGSPASPTHTVVLVPPVSGGSSLIVGACDEGAGTGLVVDAARSRTAVSALAALSQKPGSDCSDSALDGARDSARESSLAAVVSGASGASGLSTGQSGEGCEGATAASSSTVTASTLTAGASPREYADDPPQTVDSQADGSGKLSSPRDCAYTPPVSGSGQPREHAGAPPAAAKGSGRGKISGGEEVCTGGVAPSDKGGDASYVGPLTMQV